MAKGQDYLKARLGKVSAKTLSLGAKQFVRGRNEQKIKFEEEFIYPRLSGPRHIRLVKIQEGKDTDVVSCLISEVCLDESPTFEALSYTWDLDPQLNIFKLEMVKDEKNEERPILCNGKTRHITMNLYHALTELRRQKLQIPIWADQICIDQENSNEKAAQLAIMAEIYRHASCVTIWLGKLSSTRNSALDFMEGLSEEPTRAVRNPSSSESVTKMQKLSRPLDAFSSISTSVGEHYHYFASILIIGRQWFSRAWTLQEFLLAKKFRLLMGNREIVPGTIIKASKHIIEFYRTDPLSTQAGTNVFFVSLRRSIRARATMFDERDQFHNGKRYSAEEYLGVIRVRRATTIKDKVIAGAALLEIGTSSGIDYRSTTLDIYTAFTLNHLWPETKVFTLSLVGGTVPDVEGLPSWMPDLNRRLSPEPLRYCGCPTFNIPVLALDTEPTVDEKTLRIDATEWDTVESVGESIWSWTKFDDEPYNSDPLKKMRSSDSAPKERFGMMFALLDKLGNTYAPTGEKTIDVFWQTLIGGANLKTDDDLSGWRDRFNKWFAFTLLSIRSIFLDQKNKSGKLLSSSPNEWMVPLIADWDKLEQRVSSFLDRCDLYAEDGGASDSPIRRTISRMARQLWGADQIESYGSWKRPVAEILAVVREEGFYEPISVFGEHFQAVYGGRRIFVSKKGYLCTSTEAVTAGDMICLVAGADVPYVLRPVAKKERTFILVGEAYVHGIMDGGDDLVKELQIQSITII